MGGVEKIVLFRLLQPDNKNSSKCDRGENYTEKRRRRGTFCAKYLHHIFWALPNSRNKAVQNRRPITLFPSFSLGRIRETRNSGYKNKPPNLGEHCIEVRFEEQGKPNWHDEQWCAKIIKICLIYILLFSYTHTYFPLSWFWPQLPQDSPALPDDGEYGVGNIIYICFFGGKLSFVRSFFAVERILRTQRRRRKNRRERLPQRKKPMKSSKFI